MPVFSVADGNAASVPGGVAGDGITIIGAGAVGLAMAVALARMEQHVTVIEAGPREPRTDFQAANQGPASGRTYPGMIEGRMKALGGTTRLWGGQLMPFDQADFATIMPDGTQAWPITHAEYGPWLDEAHALLGIPPAARNATAAWERAAGRSTALGDRYAATLNPWLEQPDFARLFAQELETNPRIRVLTDVALAGLHFAPDGNVAEITLAPAEGEPFRIAPRQLVLAHGTIEICGSLLRAQHAENCPFADNAHVGRHYFDHLHGLAGQLAAADPATLARLFDNLYLSGRKYNVKLRATEQRRAAGQPNILATINPAIGAGQLVRDAIGLLKRAVTLRGSPLEAARHGLATLRILLPAAWRYLVRRRALNLYSRGTWLGLEIEQLPDGQSHVFLDPDEPPQTARAGIHWHVSTDLMPAIRATCEELALVLEAERIGRLEIDRRIVDGDPAFLDACHEANHHMGGARMADSPDRGVVDCNSRVFGTRNLHVAGAAIFPAGSAANPTLTAIALALRLADHLARQAQAEDAGG